MDPYSMLQLATTRRDDLVREAEADRLARDAREQAQPDPRSAPRGAPRLRIAG